MAEMKNICGKIPVELHEKVRAEIEEKKRVHRYSSGR